MEIGTLFRGAIGPEVEQLQRALFDRGLYLDIIDGKFGARTEQALRAFQQKENLVADGVAGPVTLRALGLIEDDTQVDAMTGLSVEIVSRMCPGARLQNIRTHLPNVIDALIAQGLEERPMVLMAIATIRTESAGFVPISEFKSDFNTAPGGPPFGKYEEPHRKLGNVQAGDGALFRGRGFIQLTGRANYQKYGPLLKPPIDLLQFPERANESRVAADLLCLFLKSREGRIKAALRAGDFAEARSLVNGGVHGVDVFTESFQTGARLMPEPVVPPAAAGAVAPT